MSNEITKFEESKVELLREMFFRGSSQAELDMFVYACKRTGLDPFMKQIYPVKRWNPDLKKEVMTVQTGIDGYRLIAERTGRYAPGPEPIFNFNDKGQFISATAYVKKQTQDGSWHTVAATAFFDEYAQRKKDGDLTSMWQKMPKGQTAKCAEALALRRAFPAEMSGVYTKEEMEQADAQEIHVKPLNEPSPQLEYITKEQVTELDNYLSECDPKFKASVLEFIKVSSGVEDLAALQTRHYKGTLDKAIANREAFIAKQMAEVNNESN